ncbi:MAG: glycosyltransferase [Bacteroidales bacterium]|nr:glycosyltransferase [Bacteroidales bacterium]
MAKTNNKVVLSVTNDLYTDPRVDKVCNFLTRNGFDVTLVGRRYGDSATLAPRAYKTHRLRLLFRKGAFFYAEYNIRLFFYLLFHHFDLFVANDLDTLLPNFLISKLKRKRLVYDSHEYFCGELSIADRPFVKRVWKSIERFCFPKLKDVITVSQSIVDQYEQEYAIRPHLVRNIPPKATPPVTETRVSLQLPEDKTIIILQGNGINEGRGGEELVEAMPFVDEKAVFLIVGNGTVIPRLKEKVKDLQLEHRVRFVPRVTPEMLYNYTYLSDIGIALDRDLSMNLRFSLPNKLFEYIKAGTPVVVSNLIERARIVGQYRVGLIVEDFQAENIAEKINKLVNDKQLYDEMKANCKIAAEDLCWENEEKVLEEIYLRERE